MVTERVETTQILSKEYYVLKWSVEPLRKAVRRFQNSGNQMKKPQIFGIYLRQFSEESLFLWVFLLGLGSRKSRGVRESK